jgi:hypothetical protein
MKTIYKEKHVLGSSPDFSMLLELIKKFYGGNEKTVKLAANSNKYYDIYNKDGSILGGVFACKKGNRFRFSIKE